jgi:hypothetical protein
VGVLLLVLDINSVFGGAKVPPIFNKASNPSCCVLISGCPIIGFRYKFKHIINGLKLIYIVSRILIPRHTISGLIIFYTTFKFDANPIKN